MKNSFFKNLSIACFVPTILAAAFCALSGRASWALGIFVSSCWMFLNIAMLFRLIEIGLGAGAPNKIFVLSIVKFPVLYVAGYLILKTNAFPVYSLFLGITLFMAVFVLCWLKFNVSRQLLGRAA